MNRDPHPRTPVKRGIAPAPGSARPRIRIKTCSHCLHRLFIEQGGDAVAPGDEFQIVERHVCQMNRH